MILTVFWIFNAVSFAYCIDSAAVRYGISPLLLEAIIRVESSGNPYAVSFCVLSPERDNVQNILQAEHIAFSQFKLGKKVCFSAFPDSREKAERLLQYVSATALSYDVGLMQINKLWIEKYSLRPEWLLDACYSAYWGAYVLAKMIDKYGYNWEAVWHYNGNRKYADKVLIELERLCGNKETGYCLEIKRYLGRQKR